MGRAPYSKNLRQPDETTHYERIVQDIVELGDLTVGRVVHQPGWRWRTDMQPMVGGEWCQARHVGVVIDGRLEVELADGTTFVLEPDDVFDIPPGHDGRVLGDEELVMIEWRGLRAWTGFTGGSQNRVLVTLLFTDLVDSTARATELGDAAWRDRLSTHFESARNAFERFRGHEIKTTGDGLLVTFSVPRAALDCAAAIRDASIQDDLHIRAGVHTGEVQLVGDDVRGAAVHAAARIMALAGADEILVSDTTRVLAAPEMSFEQRGTHTLKGLPGEWSVFAYLD
jgi:class 3 adenylate cyclase